MSSRTALSQVVLPGPPALSDEAATKNYVDTAVGPAGGALKAHGTTGLLSTSFGLMDTSGPWTLCPVEYRVTVSAAVGDVVQWIPDLIVYRGEDSAHDLAAVVGGAPARFASSQAAAQAANGHGAMYLGGAGTFASSWPVMVWQVQAGDLENGNLTLALMYRASGSGNRVGSTNPAAYPNNQIEVLNWGPVTAPGDDLTGRVIALEEAIGAPNGIATLDATTHVPIAQLPVGSTAGTVAAGDDARLSDARTPLAHTHAQSDVTGLTTDLAARQLTSEKNQNNGYAGLDAGGLVPIARLPVGTTSGTIAGGDTLQALTVDVLRLEENPHREDRDLYGDFISSMSRHSVTGSVTLVNGTIYAVRLSVRSSVAATALRLVTAVAGAAGTCAIALYEGSTTANFAQVRSGTINMATLGRVTHNLSSTYTTGDNTNLLIAILPLSYTTAPQVGGITGVVAASMLNPNTALAVSVTKAGQAALPAAIDLTDNTWTLTVTSKLWVALG